MIDTGKIVALDQVHTHSSTHPKEFMMTAAQVSSLNARRRTKAQAQTLHQRLIAAQIVKDEAVAAYDALVAEAREQYKTLGAYEADGVKVQISPNRTLDKKRAVVEYGEAVCSPQFDTALAKKVLTGAQYEGLYNEGANKVTVSVVK